MTKLEEAVGNYEKAGEEAFNAVMIAIAGRTCIDEEELRKLRGRLLLGQLSGARAENKMLDLTQVVVAQKKALGGSKLDRKHIREVAEFLGNDPMRSVEVENGR